ncbi:hypothetical protein NECAME_10140 [Necator americanus]|uniref:Uncharacterized protein n=1 Tax=Necator americanus TaxID=51031 RepID=W2TAC4_NECAM|nr:hypothetical protein NECAME_10140 [Necator americanus]ETN78778.1 hypothetical protein NECAME_10140 [Necator americanus]
MNPQYSWLPSPLRSVTTTQASNVVVPSSGSKLLQPTRIAQSRDKQGLSPGRTAGSGVLRPPNSNIRPPSRGNGNNNGSTLSSSNASSIASSSTYQSISDNNTPKAKSTSTSHLKPASSTANLKTPSIVKPRQIQASAKSQLAPSKTTITKPSALKPPATSTSAAASG